MNFLEADFEIVFLLCEGKMAILVKNKDFFSRKSLLYQKKIHL